MKLLHTSDWHIGRTLYGHRRHEEHESFLNWLADVITTQQVDVLLVAGDVFDNSTPTNLAQELYYRFLCRIAASSCRHVVITAGNHDSPSFLNAPKDILRFLNVYVVGAKSAFVEDDVFVLNDSNGLPELIVCAVPYLRDRDIRIVEPGESVQDKNQKLLEGIQAHYQSICAVAEQLRLEIGKHVPIIATGHLFASGGQTIEDDGVRELYIGSLVHISTDIFPECIDYLALGHLHVPQKLNGSDAIRYSGSPIPMGFGEANQEKVVIVVDFSCKPSLIQPISVPRFQEIERICGNWDTIDRHLDRLKASGSSVLLDIVYDGEAVVGDLRERLAEATRDTNLEILRVKNNRVIHQAMRSLETDEELDDLEINTVFERCMDAQAIPVEQRGELQCMYRNVVASLQENSEEGGTNREDTAIKV